MSRKFAFALSLFILLSPLLLLTFNSVDLKASDGSTSAGRILWDSSHAEELLISFSIFINELESASYEVTELTRGPITDLVLEEYEILVIVSPIVFFSATEIDAIANFVQNGHGLIQFCAYAYNCRDVANTISTNFGVTFVIDMVKDPTTNDGHDYLPIIHEMELHPVTHGIGHFVLEEPCTFQFSGNVEIIAWGDEDAYCEMYPVGTLPPVLATSILGDGRAIFIPDTDIFKGWFINKYNNKQLGLNIFEWLSAPARNMDLIEQYFPYFIFDEEEQLFPTDFLYDDNDIINNPSNYDKDSWPTTVYVHTVEGRWRDWSKPSLEPIVNDYLVIQYWFYYAKDPKMWEIPILGTHDHDWESVFIFLEKKDLEPEPEWVVYFHHGGGVWWTGDLQDSWDLVPWENPLCPACDVDRVDGTHPVVHVARHSHASYPWTIGGLSRPAQTVVVPVVHHQGVEFIELPYVEHCDGGRKLDYNHFEIVLVEEPPSDWPNMFGEIPAPWAKDDAYVRIRRRWDDPGHLLRKIEKLSIMAMSPINLLIIAPDDLRIGYDPQTQSVVNEIAYAEYSGLNSEPQVITIPDPMLGNYTIDVYGTGTGNYTITVISTSVNGTVIGTLTFNGTASQGRLETFSIELREDYTVIPELPSFLILPLFMIATLLTVVVYRRKHTRWNFKEREFAGDNPRVEASLGFNHDTNLLF